MAAKKPKAKTFELGFFVSAALKAIDAPHSGGYARTIACADGLRRFHLIAASGLHYMVISTDRDALARHCRRNYNCDVSQAAVFSGLASRASSEEIRACMFDAGITKRDRVFWTVIRQVQGQTSSWYEQAPLRAKGDA